MFKKTKNGVEIDSQEADRASAPRMKKDFKKFGKKRARSQKVAAMMGRARKGE